MKMKKKVGMKTAYLRNIRKLPFYARKMDAVESFIMQLNLINIFFLVIVTIKMKCAQKLEQEDTLAVSLTESKAITSRKSSLKIGWGLKVKRYTFST